MTKLIKSFFFVSAFSPGLIVLAVLRYYTEKTIDAEVVSLLLIVVLLSVLAWFIVLGVRTMGEVMPMQFKKLESNDSAIVPFLAAYSAPSVLRLFGFEYSAIRMCFFILFGIGFVVSYFPVHPFLRLMGYHFYKAETDDGMVYTLVTTKEVRNKDKIKSVIRVSETLLFEANNNELIRADERSSKPHS